MVVVIVRWQRHCRESLRECLPFCDNRLPIEHLSMSLALSRRIWVPLFVIGIALIARPAHADDQQTARAAFQEGVKAFQASDYRAALAKFEEAERASHSAVIRYNIARALEKLEQPQRAVAEYEAYVAEAGESGEFTGAATVAIAQIKAKSTRLRIDSKPPGASVKLNDQELTEKTPLTVLVPAGSQRVSVQIDKWSETRNYEASGNGSTGEIVFVRPVAAKVIVKTVTPPVRKPQIDGLVGSFGLSLSAYSFVGKGEEGDSTADSQAKGVVFGLTFDVGYALSQQWAILARGFGALGSAKGSLASLAAGGPVASVRLGEDWWVGGGIVVGAGRADSSGNLIAAGSDTNVTFETQLALGPTIELTYVIDQNDDGHWIASLMPTTLLTTGGQESTIVVPLIIGYRWF
jgi:hypothetical protein